MSDFVIESWIWYGFTILMVGARFAARLLHFKSPLRLQVEDWLMLFLTCLYTILIVFLNIDAKVSTNLIDPKDIPALTREEIAQRTWGSKTVLLVEQCMCAVQWGTKTCLLILYWRLTQNLTQNMVVKIAAAYIGVSYIVMEVLYFAYWCRPFSDYWETPTDNVQCTTALNHLILNLAFNLSSDILIMSIPLPLLLKAHLEIKRKLLLIFPFSLGLFTMLCAILSKRLTFTQPFSANWVYWYCREASTAMIVTNMPYSWALIRRIFNLKSFFGDSENDIVGAEMSTTPGYSISEAGVDANQQSQAESDAQRKNSLLSIATFGARRKSSALPDFVLPPSRRPSTWTDQSTRARHKERDVNSDSTNCSSAGSNTRIQTATNTTADALDKLYPLEDDDDDDDHELGRNTLPTSNSTHNANE